MQYVAWKFRSLTVPMILGDDGVLYTTSKAISAGLGIHPKSLIYMYRGGKGYSNIRVNDFYLKEFFMEHRKEFGIGRFKEDMRIWTETDMIKFAARATSEAADDFMEGVIELVKEHARKDGISRHEYEIMQQDMRDLKETVKEMSIALQAAAGEESPRPPKKSVRNLKLVLTEG